MPVHTSDGEQLGTVHRVLDNALENYVVLKMAKNPPHDGTVHSVLDNAREHIFDGIVVDTPNGRRFVDAPEVVRITRRRVTLSIDAAEARQLPEPYTGRGWRRWLPGG